MEKSFLVWCNAIVSPVEGTHCVYPGRGFFSLMKSPAVAQFSYKKKKNKAISIYQRPEASHKSLDLPLVY